ncbi:MAG TPA: response regulator [Longimicrobium sp.]
MMKLVLVVDDDEDQHEILGVLLQHYGYATVHAHTVSRARAMLAERRPDVILLDVTLPGEHGLDLLYSLHLSDPALPVVVITADPLARFRYPKAVANASAWLLKPAFTSDLREVLRGLIGDPE